MDSLKKVISIIAAVLMLAVLFTGCSSSEIGLYQTIKGMQSLTNYTFSGDVSFDIRNLQLTGEEADNTGIAVIKELLKCSTLTYDGSINSAQNKLEFNLGFKTADFTQNLFNVISDGKSLYINKEIAVQYFPKECKYTEETIKGVTYAKYNTADLINVIENAKFAENVPDDPYDINGQPDQYQGYSEGCYAGYSDGYCSLEKNETAPDGSDDYQKAYVEGYDAGYSAGAADVLANENNDALALQQYLPYIKSIVSLNNTSGRSLQAKVSTLEDKAVSDLFDKLDLGIVSKTGDNQYSANLTLDNTIAAAQKAVSYLTDSTNLTKLKKMLADFVNSLSKEEMESLAPDMTKDQIIDEINNITLSNDDSDAILKSIDDMKAELVKEFDTSATSLSFSIAKTANDTYNTASTFSIKTKAGNDMGIDADLSVKMNLTVNKAAAAPTHIIQKVSHLPRHTLRRAA